MKSRRHKNGSVPFSLFSFQDIITGISGIMIFVLLILSLELTIPQEKKKSEEEIRKTLFAEDPMEVFVAGKLEIANSHTAMSKEEILDLYLENGATYFELKEKEESQVKGDEGALNTNKLKQDQIAGLQENDKDGQVANKAEQPVNAAGKPANAEPAEQPPENEKGEEPEDPLHKTFKWLGEQQNADGSWDEQHKHGISGLVLMAYLAYKERTGNPEFDEALYKGIEFLVKDENCKPGTDKFAYQNGIKALALTEAVRILGTEPKIEKAIKDSITFIVVGQQDKGGFNYNYNTKTKTQDLSVAAWNLLALHSADKLYSIDVAHDAIEKAKPWLTAMSEKQFTYNTKNHLPSENPKESKIENMRAIGTWLTLVVNKENFDNVKDDLAAIATESYDNLKWQTKKDHPLYGWNYATMCMMTAGGQFREKWKAKLGEILIANQTVAGYWSPLRFRHGSKPIYTTAFCAHMLALVYDHSNAVYSGPPKGLGSRDSAPKPFESPVAANSQPSEKAEASPENKATEGTNPTAVNGSQESPEQKTAKLEISKTETKNGEFDNLISLDKNKAQEIKKRLNVFRRSIKSDSEVRAELEKLDLGELNNSIVTFLNRKHFLETQLNKMSKDPYIHDAELLKDRYIYLNKEVTKLMKKINLYETDNSGELVFNPIKMYVSSKELNIKLSDGQKLRFSCTGDGIKNFQAWLQGKDKLKDVLMINIKPSGVGVYRRLDNLIEILDFKTLTIPVDENTEVD